MSSPVDARTYTWPSPLVAAARYGPTKVLGLLLERAKGVETRTMDQALLMACSQGHEQDARLLVEHGSSPASRSDMGETPLLAAMEECGEELASYLLDRGAGIEERDGLGRTPLQLAVLHSRLDLVRLLISRGADIDARDAAGNTALMLAAYRGERDCALTLIEAKAQVSARNVHGESVLSLARAGKHEELVNTLDHYLSGRFVLEGAPPASQNKELVKDLEQVGATGSSIGHPLFGSPLPQPSGADAAALVIRVKTTQPFLFKKKGVVIPLDGVVFLRLDDDSRSDPPRGELVASNYKDDGYAFLFNARPGRYLAVASQCSFTTTESQPGATPRTYTQEYTTLFSRDLVLATEVLVRPGELAMMGDYVVIVQEQGGAQSMQSLWDNGESYARLADDTQWYFQRRLEAAPRERNLYGRLSDEGRHWGTLVESGNAGDAGAALSPSLQETLRKAGWPSQALVGHPK